MRRTYLAGGLEELHLVRGVNTLSMLRILLDDRPDVVKGAVRASGTLRTGKALEKACMIKCICAERGRANLPGSQRCSCRPRQRPPRRHGRRYAASTSPNIWASN